MSGIPANSKRVTGDLAIHGGKPVRDRLLPYGRQLIEDDDISAVVKVLRGDWITQGPKIEEFERAVADYCGSKYGVAFSSGTAALHAACAVSGLKDNDEAITTPLTFAATANAVLYCGATPVFADICDDTLNIDVKLVERTLTKRTKVIIPVDFAGHPADLDAILSLAADHKVIVIEDACHALGAQHRSRRVGSISHMTVFSFHPVKHLTTGEGGMVMTNDSDFARRLRIFRNHGIESDPRQRQQEGGWYYEMKSLGYNYRLTDIGCALGLSQLGKLDQNLTRRRQIAEEYVRSFSDIPELRLPVEKTEVSCVWHLYPVRLQLQRLRVGRAEVFHALRAENIGVNVHYIPVHYHPYYQKRFGFKRGQYPEAENAYECLVTLPIFHSMTFQDVEDVVTAIKKVVHHYRS
jgi:UDP-4-amino-4,6-dideoxy-N-acetyl-beta-L-altrosamine transaminase